MDITQQKWLATKSRMAAMNILDGCNAECIFVTVSVESKCQL